MISYAEASGCLEISWASSKPDVSPNLFSPPPVVTTFCCLSFLSLSMLLLILNWTVFLFYRFSLRSLAKAAPSSSLSKSSSLGPLWILAGFFLPPTTSLSCSPFESSSPPLTLPLKKSESKESRPWNELSYADSKSSSSEPAASSCGAKMPWFQKFSSSSIALPTSAFIRLPLVSRLGRILGYWTIAAASLSFRSRLFFSISSFLYDFSSSSFISSS